MFKSGDYRLRIKALQDTLEEAKYALDIDNGIVRLEELKKEQEKPEVWNNLELTKKLAREQAGIENKVKVYENSKKALADAEDVVDLIEETGDEDLIPELDGMLVTAEKDIEETRINALLRGKYDSASALLTLHAGAGGTEACDWTSMLYLSLIHI